MGTYTTLPGHGAEVTAAYRELEVAYHELQVAQVHLRSIHARSMHDRTRDRTLLRQELARLSDLVDTTMQSYRAALADYIDATNALLSEEKGAPVSPPSRTSTARFRTETPS